MFLRPDSKTMNSHKILLVFGAFLLAMALSLIVRLLEDRKVRSRQGKKGVDSASDR